MTLPEIKVYASRDFKHYRVVSSPVADIAARFYGFMSSNSEAASHARYAYATAYQGVEPRTPGGFQGSELDHAVQHMLAHPPIIVFAQGPMHPWGLFEDAELQSISSEATGTSAVQLDPVNCIFLPWAVHQALKEGMEGDDEQDKAVASFFLLAGIVHETAHWIAACRHGYKRDPTRDRKKTSLLAKLDFTKTKITTHTRRDWGTHAKELLLGCAYTFMSYADGTHEVVSERVKPVLPHLRPALSPEVQTHCTGFPLPEVIDISKYGTPKEHEVPKWRPKSDFLVVSCMSPDFACHHGACRLRD
ncbi:hypothetical protein DICSQDRAFT_137595 [Dichomitus squalens LYAD-421 SS1]|uniref:Uncharacterized protein n=2 Tax=Dichomitus squalens TaxID=114155 RepID=A0A4Q9MPQ1_9APHY|nr:uncharacterized protein DICSQDRAFT_137595 [Dichomitus squalens LYAD-421 SS1]EJF60256.1 hypothetical protein DICSQDRAFT_137595 [Dichomitus squalens LYAD-421 SS1]TBU28422.1 hypothetical protein BD311DRAFT_663497 [Dichomitus squalens]